MKLRIAKLRAKKGITQAELGDAVGLGQNSISRIESGKQQPTLESLDRIASYFGVTFMDLFADYDRSEVEREIQSLLSTMTDEKQAAVLTFARMLSTQKAG